MLGFITIALLVGEALVRIGLILRIVMQRRPVSTTLAWVLALLLTPIVGIVGYLLIGEPRLSRGRARRHLRIAEDLETRALTFWRTGTVDWTSSAEPFDGIARLGSSATGLPPLRSNHLKLIADTDEYIDALIAEIDHAKSYCHLEYYIWAPGGRPDEVIDALGRAASRGVECRVLIDDVGSRPFADSGRCQILENLGVKVQRALPVNPFRAALARIDLRNHRKVTIVDGRVAFVGSQNLTDRTFKVSRKKRIGPWIDASMRIEGPAAQALDVSFLRDWLLERPADKIDIASHFVDLPSTEGGSTVQVLPSGPGEAPAAIQRVILETIHTASEELIITTPYLVPDDATRSALESAAMRGVETTLVVPARIDAPLVALASRAEYQNFLDAGVHIRLYQPGLLHAKTITVDRALALIGSSNLDMRSFWLNFESTVIVYDSDVASMVRWLQQQYIEDSVPVDPAAWKRRFVARRAAENVARIFGPLL